MILRYAFLLLLLFPATLLPAQNYDWTSSISCTNRSIPDGIATDSRGNVILTGTFAFTADFDPSGGVTSLSTGNFGAAFVQKLDSNRNLLWVQKIDFPNGGEVAGVLVDQDDNIIIS
ncbi:MAG: hypothetical protein AAF570_14275, partial [Bacteroidota bacterium]